MVMFKQIGSEPLKSNRLISCKFGTKNLYLYIQRVRNKKTGRVYRYLVIEDYQGNGKRPPLLRISIDKAIEILLSWKYGSWCGGWDLNPRRPTPSGPQPKPHLTRKSAGHISFKQDEALEISTSAEKLNEFYSWCLGHASNETCSQYLKYLSKPLNRKNRWSVTAYKKYLRYLCEEHGDEKACILFKKIRSRKSGVDKYVPGLEEVLETISRAEEPYRTVYKYLLITGLRLNEVTFLLSNIDRLRKTRLDGFYRIETDLERGTKKSFVAYTIELPEKIVIEPHSVTKYSQRNKLLQPKYFRKFVATQMAKLGIPDRAIDFIQGRTPMKILRKHYLDLTALADIEYSKYAEWLRETLAKLLIKNN